MMLFFSPFLFFEAFFRTYERIETIFNDVNVEHGGIVEEDDDSSLVRYQRRHLLVENSNKIKQVHFEN